MSVQVQQQKDRAAVETATKDVPYVPIDANEVLDWDYPPFPLLGEIVPDGWERLDREWFIATEPNAEKAEDQALTSQQFRHALFHYVRANDGVGFAYVEIQDHFNATVAAYKKLV